MVKRRVFFSWQSDLSKNRNMSLIENALEAAAKRISGDGSIQVEPVIDRDTSGVPGAPDIAETIFTKIENCHVFVADVSIINPGSSGRPTPNPNVLLELGYAARVLTWDRILLVMNSTMGGPDQLPFDIRSKRVLSYTAREDEPPANARNGLRGQFEMALRAILSSTDAQATDDAVLAIAGNIVREQTRGFGSDDVLQDLVWSQTIVERGKANELAEDQVIDALQSLEHRGWLELTELSGGNAFNFTAVGFSEYWKRNLPGFDQTYSDIAAQFVARDAPEAWRLPELVDQPPGLVGAILDLMDSTGAIELMKTSGDGRPLSGTDVMSVSVELKRFVSADSGRT